MAEVAEDVLRRRRFGLTEGTRRVGLPVAGVVGDLCPHPLDVLGSHVGQHGRTTGPGVGAGHRPLGRAGLAPVGAVGARQGLPVPAHPERVGVAVQPCLDVEGGVGELLARAERDAHVADAHHLDVHRCGLLDRGQRRAGVAVGDRDAGLLQLVVQLGLVERRGVDDLVAEFERIDPGLVLDAVPERVGHAQRVGVLGAVGEAEDRQLCVPVEEPVGVAVGQPRRGSHHRRREAT